MAQEETIEGYVIDIGCIRKNFRDDLMESARTHTRECGLMGHCIESGYGIVSEEDTVTLLDAAATPRVVDALRASDKDQGIMLRVEREIAEGNPETVRVEEI